MKLYNSFQFLDAIKLKMHIVTLLIVTIFNEIQKNCKNAFEKLYTKTQFLTLLINRSILLDAFFLNVHTFFSFQLGSRNSVFLIEIPATSSLASISGLYVLLNHCKKTHQNPLSSFKDLSIHRR